MNGELRPHPKPYYTLDNFTTVLDWLAARYGDLLDADERAFMAAFADLPLASRALFVRMLMRRGPILRESRLDYAEIGPTAAALAPLLAAGLVEEAPALTLDDVFDLLTLPELAPLFGLPKGARKAAQLEALRPHYSQARPWRAWAPESAERMLLLPQAGLCERLRILFFGNAHQDWSEFVLADLGIFRYEKVTLAADARAFRTRADFAHYLRLVEARRRLEEGEDALALDAALPPAPDGNAWLGGRHARLRFALAQQAEREGRHAEALAIYAGCGWRGARARAVRMLELLGRAAEACDLAEAACAAPEDDAEAQAIARMLPRLARAAGRPRPPRIALREADDVTLTLPAPEEDYWVEELARLHFHAPEAPVFYVENALVNSLFGLLCWDAIFLDVPGAFFHPFQAGPADLHAPDFRARRAAAFDAALGLLEGDGWREVIRARYRDKAGIASPFVYWEALDDTLLELALTCIPGAHLRLLAERLLADIKANRSGFPDLVQFWPAERRYRFIEVKGPGDRLQDNQRRLLDHCVAHGLPVLVCYVRWQDAGQEGDVQEGDA